jgi:hypothetical protein
MIVVVIYKLIGTKRMSWVIEKLNKTIMKVKARQLGWLLSKKETQYKG